MAVFEVIHGGLSFKDPDEIPAPDRPAEEWTEAEHEAFFLYCWDNAEDSTLEFSVKNLSVPADAIATAADVLEKIRLACAEGAARTGLRNEFDYEQLPHLLRCLQQRVQEDKTKMAMAE